MSPRLRKAALVSLAVLSTLVVAVGVYLHTPHFRSVVERRVEGAVRSLVGRDVSLRVAELDPLRLRARLVDVTVAGRDRARPALFEARAIEVDVAWSTLFGDVRLDALAARGPVLDLDELPDAPQEPDDEGGELADLLDPVVIDRLEVDAGILRSKSTTAPVGLDARGVRLEARYDAMSAAYEGTLGIDEGRLEAPPLSRTAFRLETSIRLDSEALRLDDVTLEADGLSLEGRGALSELSALAYEASAEVRLLPARWPIEGDTPMPEGEIRAKGRVEGRGGDVRFGFDLASDALTWSDLSVRDLSARLESHDGRVALEGVRASVLGVAVEGRAGSVEAGAIYPIEGGFQLRTDRPAEAARALDPRMARLEGDVRGAIDFRVEAAALDGIEATATVEADGLAFAGQPSAGVSAELEAAFEDGALRIERLISTAGASTLELAGTIGIERPSRLRLDARLLELAELTPVMRSALRALDVEVPPGLEGGAMAGSVALRAELDGPAVGRLGLAAVTGQVEVELSGVRAAPFAEASLEGGAPSVSGTLDVRIAASRLSVERSDLVGPGFEIGAAGSLDATRAHGLEVRARISEPERAWGFVRSHWRAWASSAPETPTALRGAEGTVTVVATVDGPWERPGGSLELDAHGLRVGGVEWGAFAIAAEATDGRATFDGTLEGRAARATTSGTVDLGARPIAGTVRLDVDRQSIRPLASIAGVPFDVQGELSGRADLAFPELDGTIALAVANGSIAGTPVEDLEASVRAPEDAPATVRAEMSVAGGTAEVEGELGADPAGEPVEIEARSVELGSIEPLEIVRGDLTIDARLSGSLASPRLSALLEAHRLELTGRDAPDLSARVTFDGDALALDADSPDDADARIEARLRFAPDTRSTLSLRYPLDLDLRALTAPTSDPSGSGGGRFEGAAVVDVELVLDRPTTASGVVELRDPVLHVAERRFRTDGPIVVDLGDARATLRPVAIVDGDHRLSLRGEAALGRERDARLDVDGTLGLALLGAIDPTITSRGAVEVELDIEADPVDVRASGSLDLRGGAIELPEAGLALTELDARVELDDDAVRLTELRSRLGGGPIEASGRIAFEGFTPTDFRFDVAGDRVRFAPSGALRVELGFDVALEGRVGSEPPGTLSGRVDIVRALYDEPFDLEREVLSRGREFAPYSEGFPAIVRAIALDLEVVADDGIWVRNELASLEARADLEIGGTIGRPAISGRVVTLDGGQVVFREVRYQVTGGSVDFRGRQDIDPFLDVRAETSVADYDVMLSVTGTLDDFRFDLASTPPLPRADIVTLLLTGKTRADFGPGQGGGLTRAQVAQYLSRGVAGNVEDFLAETLGLDRVQVDPTLVGAEADPSTRITLGKSITDRLTAVYSTALGGDLEDVYLATYRLGEHVDLVGSRDDDGSLSGDVRYADSHYVGPGEGGVGRRSRREVASIRFEGNARADAERLGKLLRLDPGDPYRESRLLEGLDRIRRWYREHQRPEARVERVVESTEAGARITVRVDEGRRIELVFRGIDASKAMREAVLETWAESVFPELRAERAAEAVRDRLRSKGFVDAAVDGRVEEIEPGFARAVLEVERGTRVQVDRIRIEGAEAFDVDRIRSQLLTERDDLFSRGRLDPGTLEDDAAAVRNLYSNYGYLDVEVEHDYTVNASGDRAVVTIRVDEGTRYRLGSIATSGNERFDDETLARRIGLRAGETYEEDAADEAEGRILEAYDAIGFPDSEVRTRRTFHRETATVDVRFEIDEGAYKEIDEIRIVDRGMTDRDVLRRLLTIEVGDPLSLEALYDSRFALYQTGLFRSVEFEREPRGDGTHEAVVFTVREADNLDSAYGLGFDTEEGFRVSADVSHRNLWGRRFYAGAGTRWSQTDKRGQLTLRQPSLGGSVYEGLVSSFWESRTRDAFSVRTLGLSFQTTRRRGPSTWILGYELEDDTITQGGVTLPSGDVTIIEEVDLRRRTDVRLASVVLSAGRDTRDDVFWPTSGTYARGEIRLFHPSLWSEREFLRGLFQWSGYVRPFGDAIWLSGVRVGFVEPRAEDDIPISKRFFAGGEASLRGFGRDEVEPVGFPFTDAQLEAAGISIEESLGGKGLFLLNQELLLPVEDPVFALLFVDAGNIYWDVEDLDPTDVRWNAGVGVRVRTPVGPVRAEYGWKLDREPGESSGAFHFSIGIAF